MSGAIDEGVAPSSPDEPDAVGRGWIRYGTAPDEPALFILTGSWLGANVAEHLEWYGLADVVNLDALGAPDGGIQTVELSMGTGRVLIAGWPEAFCANVVDALVATIDAASASGAGAPPAPAAAAPVPSPPAPVPTSPAPPAPTPVATAPAVGPSPAPAAATAPASPPSPSIAPAPAPGTASAPTSDRVPDPTPAPASAAGAEVPESGAAALVLEDVTYLGGYPGQGKKRKKCTATLTRDAVELSGPNALAFRVPWEFVRTIEAQNADEARFRMNTKIHRDATALVLECDQDVTILLEARDCPTIPLRGAIAQLVTDLSVVVV